MKKINKNNKYKDWKGETIRFPKRKKKQKTNWTAFILGCATVMLFAATVWGQKVNRNIESQIEILEEQKYLLRKQIELLEEMTEPETEDHPISYWETVHGKYKPTNKWAGEASYYDTNGCQGCRSDRRMKNGEVLDDNAMNLAFNYLPMNSIVSVTNVDTNKTVTAKVTDTGGFNQKGRDMYYEATGVRINNDLDRVADLSRGLKESLGCADICNVEITTL